MSLCLLDLLRYYDVTRELSRKFRYPNVSVMENAISVTVRWEDSTTTLVALGEVCPHQETPPVGSFVGSPLIRPLLKGCMYHCTLQTVFLVSAGCPMSRDGYGLEGDRKPRVAG